jgi:hypothetical protein
VADAKKCDVCKKFYDCLSFEQFEKIDLQLLFTVQGCDDCLSEGD